jgi:hypothetical protein
MQELSAAPADKTPPKTLAFLNFQPKAGRFYTLLIRGEGAAQKLDLLEDEFEVWIVTDACSSRTERNRDAAFDRLAGAGAELVTTEMVAFEWLRSAEHPAFKQVQALFK